MQTRRGLQTGLNTSNANSLVREAHQTFAVEDAKAPDLRYPKRLKLLEEDVALFIFFPSSPTFFVFLSLFFFFEEVSSIILNRRMLPSSCHRLKY